MPPIARHYLLLPVLAAACGSVAAPSATVERLFVLDGGGHHTTDLSRWSPGINQGTAWDFGNHCYLIRHRRGLLLWDTGFADEIAALPDGLVLGDGTVRVRVCFDNQGIVTEVTVEQSSGFPALDQAALRAGKQYRFKPGVQGGVPQAGCLTAPMLFRMLDPM